MKQLSILITTSLIFTSSCLSMEPARKTHEAQIIPLSGLLKNPTAIAFPTQTHIVIGGDNDCVLFSQISYETYSKKSIAMHKTFAIDAHKKEGFVVITNTEGILVYAPRTERIIWSNHTIPEKNIAAVFGHDKTIIALTPTDQSVMVFDYENGLLPKQRIASCILQPDSSFSTRPISCNHEQLYSSKIAYLNDKQQAAIMELSSQNTQTKESGCYKNILLSPYGQYVALAHTLQGCIIWHPRTDESYEIDDIYKPNSDEIAKLYIKAMAFHPNGCLALLTGYMLGYRLKYFNLNRRILVSDEEVPLKKLIVGNMKTLDFSPEGTDVVILAQNEFLIAPVPLTVLAQTDAN